jgi:hypothetical protein
MNPIDLVRAFLDFFKGQPFSNVVALLQLGLLSGAVWLAVFKLVPAERQAILDGMQQQEAQQTKQIDSITHSFERALDRIDQMQGSEIKTGTADLVGQ